MEKIVKKYEKMLQALDSLRRALENFKQLETITQSPIDIEELKEALRDSVIKRFEYCADHLWKYIQLYLETTLNFTLEKGGPTFTLKMCLPARLLHEEEIEQAVQMIKDRNYTSHIYQEEIADFIAKKAPGYYSLMKIILEKIKP